MGRRWRQWIPRKGRRADPKLTAFNAVNQSSLAYSKGFHQLGVQTLSVSVCFITVFTLSFSLFWIIKKTMDLRVSKRHEIEGLDISEHGM